MHIDRGTNHRLSKRCSDDIHADIYCKRGARLVPLWTIVSDRKYCKDTRTSAIAVSATPEWRATILAYGLHREGVEPRRILGSDACELRQAKSLALTTPPFCVPM